MKENNEDSNGNKVLNNSLDGIEDYIINNYKI